MVDGLLILPRFDDNRLDHIHEIVRLHEVVVKCQDLRNDVKFIKEPALVWKREYAVCSVTSITMPVSYNAPGEFQNWSISSG